MILLSTERDTGVVMSTNNVGYLSESVMRYRLDTKDIIFDIEMQLRGQAEEWVRDDNSNMMNKLVQVGVPKMNSEGIQSVITYLRGVLGPHTVQGNFERQDYDDLIAEIDTYLSENVMANLYKWNVKIEDYNHILDTIITTLRCFLSRTIDNKERESYASTMRSIESNRYEKSGGLSSLNPFRSGGGT